MEPLNFGSNKAGKLSAFIINKVSTYVLTRTSVDAMAGLAKNNSYLIGTETITNYYKIFFTI